jgi:hypothetical protein
MSLFQNFHMKKKPKIVKDKKYNEALQQSLAPYIKREDLKKYLEDIKKDERKKKIWDGLSPMMQLKVLRFVMKKKEDRNHGKV